MEFIFAEQSLFRKDDLLQGDILLKSDALKAVLVQGHRYYAEAEDYSHFMVLTQSCDLVRRKHAPKSRYITLAAARPASVVIDRFIEKNRFEFEGFPITLCDKNREIRARQLLERLMHNTEDGFFFIRKNSHPEIADDLCVFLALSVAVRSEHYDACLRAKVAQMDNIFAAKVGWLTGNLYSRIGTPDIEEQMPEAEKYKETFYEEALFGKTAWLSSYQLRLLKASVREWKSQNPGKPLDAESGKSLLDKLPSDAEIIIDRVANVLQTNGLLGDESKNVTEARNILLGDVFLNKLLKSAN